MVIQTLQYILVLSLGLSFATADFTANCPQECKCLWASGSKKTDCSHSNFHELPETVDTEIQILDLTGNELYEIKRHAFKRVGLINLKKLILRECKLETIDETGLSGLEIMIELDLSKNDLKTLHIETFRETAKIRWIFLNDNQIEKLDDELFSNLAVLQKVDLSNNRIVQLGVKTFMNVPNLNNLRLNGNKLQHLNIDSLSNLTSLFNLDLHDNPWRCDCYLQPLRDWVISNDFNTTKPVACAEPAKVHGKLWKDLNPNDFAIQSSDTNRTLPCQVNGSLPEVNWVLNAQITDNSNKYQGEIKYFVNQSNTEKSEWVNLTIVATDSSDNIEYVCVAKNSAGVKESSLTLTITHISPDKLVSSGMGNSKLPILKGGSSPASLVLIILVILCFLVYYRRRRGSQKMKDNSNGEALIEGSVITQIERSVTAVNSVTKPPRRIDANTSITSATKVSEFNNTLIDHDSIIPHKDDEKRSFDFDQHIKPSQDALNVVYGRINGQGYPADQRPSNFSL